MTNPRVSDFLRQGIFDYPGRRYDKNFITDNEFLYDIPSTTPEAFDAVDKYLKDKDLPPLSERIPVIAYGMNVSPGAMTSKFGRYPIEGTDVGHEEIHTVPVLYGAIDGSDVVWHGRPGQSGGYFAELYESEATRDTTVEVAVEFLTPEQLAIMHTTEGDTYGVSSKEITLPDGYRIEGIFYGAREASMLLDDSGAPISVAGVRRQGSSREVMTPTQALDFTLDTSSVIDEIGNITRDEYLAKAAEKTLPEKKALQTLVQRALQSAGRSTFISHPALNDQSYGRTNFVSLPKGVEATRPHSDKLELMETSIQRIRLPKDKLAKEMIRRSEEKPLLSEKAHREALDPAEKLRKFNTNALKDPNRARALAKAVPGLTSNEML
jgi:hypothetical protein